MKDKILERSIQFKIIFINSVIVFLLLILLIISSLYLINKVKKSQVDLTNEIAQNLAYNIEEELFRLNKLMNLCKNDTDFILCMSSPFKDYRYYEKCIIAQEKLEIIKYAIPYADNVYLYIRNKNKILHAEKGIFDNNSKFILLPWNKENKNFYRENNKVVYSVNVQDYGMIYIEINEKKFIDSLIQPNDMENIMYLILDNNDQVLFDSVESDNQSIKYLEEGKQVINNKKYYMIKQNMRFLNYKLFLFKSVSDLENVIIKINCIVIIIILVGVLLGVILIVLNRRIYLPIHNIIRKYNKEGKSTFLTNNEFDIIDQMIGQLVSKNTLRIAIEQRETNQNNIYEDIYLQYLTTTRSQSSEEVMMILNNKYHNCYLVLMTIEKEDGKINYDLLDKINKNIRYKKYIECENGIQMYILENSEEYGFLLKAIQQLQRELNNTTEIYVSKKFCISGTEKINSLFEQAKDSLINCTKESIKKEYVFINYEKQRDIINNIINQSEEEIAEILTNILVRDEIGINNCRENFRMLVYLLGAIIERTNFDKEKLQMKSLDIRESFNKKYMFKSLLEDYKTINSIYRIDKNDLKYLIMEYIKSNFSGDLSLDAIAEYFGISVPYLSAYFKKNVGLNLSNYIVEIRMEEAKKILIARKNIKISEVAEQVGIYSQSTFIRHFKSNTGVSPSEYRKKIHRDMFDNNSKSIEEENEDGKSY